MCFNRFIGTLACTDGMPVELSKLSSLDLIRGFVAVGRRMSVTLAAQDLFLTQSAVSRQVHALEDYLGVKLFTRGHRSLALTPEGERLFRSADSAIQQLQDVVGEIRTKGTLKPVTVSTSVGFAGLWLLPRLGKLQRLHAGIDVRVSANDRIADLRNDGIDLAIRYTSAALAPSGSQQLFAETIVPVASPALGVQSLRTVRTLSKLTLLEFDDPRYPWIQWRPWLEAKAWTHHKPRAFLHFNQYDLVIQAALAGQGVALGRLELIRPLLSEGRLALIDSHRYEPQINHGYWLVRAEQSPRREVVEFTDWLVSEARPQTGALPSDAARSGN